MKLLILYTISQKHLTKAQRHKEDKTSGNPFFSLCVLCGLRASVRDKKSNIFAAAGYEYKGENDV
jgi:hypothetical protein